MKSDVIDIEVMLVHETRNALLVRYDADEEPVWLPKSQCELEDGSGLRTLSLPQSLAEEKGMV